MTTEETTIPLCRHLKTNGLRCKSPALTAAPFCYFHTRLHKDHPAPLTAQQIVDNWHEGSAEAIAGAGEDPMQIARAYPRQNEFNFPPLEDAESIQFAASMLFHAIAQGHVHLRRARIMRDILRIASSSQRSVAARQDTAAVIREIEQTGDGVPIAAADPQSSPETKRNQYFDCKSNEINILPEPPTLNHLN